MILMDLDGFRGALRISDKLADMSGSLRSHCSLGRDSGASNIPKMNRKGECVMVIHPF